MEMDAKRVKALRNVNITHYAIVIVIVLIFAQWFMPYFRYEPTGKNDTKSQTSMWGEMLFNYNFMQLEDVMKDALPADANFKFISLRYLGAPVLMMISGIIALCTMGKKGIAYNQRTATCLETQKFPNTPNHPEWPSATLEPGQTYHSECIYKFSIDN